jgi:hypothetical protein
VAPEVEVWLSACGLSPQSHGHMLKAAGITKLIHFKVMPTDTMRNELKKTEMEAGDIELVIAGVHWYLEWRDTVDVEPKDSFPKYFTESGFERFVARWNPNQGTAVAVGAAEVRRNRDPPTTKANAAVTSSSSSVPSTDTAVLASDSVRTTTSAAPRVPTGELVDAKNTVQSHSLLAHAVAERATNSDSPSSKQELAHARSPGCASGQAAIAYAIEASHDDIDLEPPPLSANVFAVAARVKDDDEEEAGTDIDHPSDPPPPVVPAVANRGVFQGDNVDDDDDDEESLSQHSSKPETSSPAMGNDRTGPVAGRRQWQIRMAVVVVAIAIITIGVVVYAAPWRSSSESQSVAGSKSASSMNTPAAPTMPSQTTVSANVAPSLAPQSVSSSTGPLSTNLPTAPLAAPTPFLVTVALTPPPTEPMPTLAPTTMMPSSMDNMASPATLTPEMLGSTPGNVEMLTTMAPADPSAIPPSLKNPAPMIPSTFLIPSTRAPMDPVASNSASNPTSRPTTSSPTLYPTITPDPTEYPVSSSSESGPGDAANSPTAEVPTERDIQMSGRLPELAPVP